MKKILAGVLALVLLLSLVGCVSNKNPVSTHSPVDPIGMTETPTTEPVTEPPTEPTEPIALEGEKFPEGTTLYGVDVGGMGQADAFAALQAAVAAYSLRLTVNGQTITLSAEALELIASQEKFDAYFTALTGGETLPVPELLSFNQNNIRSAVVNRVGVQVQNATIAYNSSTSTFQVKPATPGLDVEPGPAVDAAKRAISALRTAATATVVTTEALPTITEESPEAASGLKKANDYLKINLKYTYAPEDVAPQTQALSKADIAGFVTFDEKLVPSISKALVESYASKMNDKYHVPGEPGKFVTTGGATIDVEVTYAGQLVDVDALTSDIYSCLTAGTSGTRTAPYLDKTVAEDMSFGGNYVEINMSAQRLWVYKNGKCVVTTPIVTGCAYYGWNTPRGVYQINKKARGVYLQGNDYVSYVKYWMAFIGRSYGLHDASWRKESEFGGNTYLYDGSHGCVNIPPSIMPTVYDNASVGTHVVIYGGATKADPLVQTLSGTSQVSTALDMPLTLDVKPEYAVDKITYTVADPTILSVSKDGVVTPLALGTTTVTVTSPQQRFYTEASFTVTVTVTDPCLEGRHTCTVWTPGTAPTCGAPGTETGICDKCGQPAQREVPATGAHTEATRTTTPTCTAAGELITYCSVCDQELKREEQTPATGHSFTADGAFCGNGCGEKNPDYVAPTEPPKEETDPSQG